MNNHTIDIVALSKTFMQGAKKIILFVDISYTFLQGKTYAITGVSGTGKSTLLNMLSGIERPESGSILYDGQNIINVSPDRARLYLQRYVGVVFQYAYLINELTVLENVALKGLIAGVSYKEANDYAIYLLEQVGLKDKLQSNPHILSGGEQQRVSLARALMMKPPFIIADEPTAHLDEYNKKSICDLLISCKEDYGAAVIVSSHDSFVVERMETILSIREARIFDDNLGYNHLDIS